MSPLLASTNPNVPNDNKKRCFVSVLVEQKAEGGEGGGDGADAPAAPKHAMTLAMFTLGKEEGVAQLKEVVLAARPKA